MTILNGKPIKDPVPTPAPTVSPAGSASPTVVLQPTNNFYGLIMGLVSIFLAFMLPPAGIVLGVVGLNQSRRAGGKNAAALVGIILGIIFTLLLIALIVLSVVWGVGLFGQLFQICQQLGEVAGNPDVNPVTCS